MSELISGGQIYNTELVMNVYILNNGVYLNMDKTIVQLLFTRKAINMQDFWGICRTAYIYVFYYTYCTETCIPFWSNGHRQVVRFSSLWGRGVLHPKFDGQCAASG